MNITNQIARYIHLKTNILVDISLNAWGDRLVFSLFSNNTGESYASCHLDNENTLWNFETNFDHRHKGYGRMLINTVISHIKKKFPEEKTLFLYCEIDNINGLGFWKKMGWKKVSEKIYEKYEKNAYKLYYNLK